MRNIVWTLASLALVVCVSATAWSSEADELRAKAKAVQHEAEVLVKKGRKEEAEKLFRHVKELLNAADKHEVKSSASSDREIDELHRQLKAIAEKEEHAEKTKDKQALAELRKHRANIERELAEHREHHEPKAGQKPIGKHSPEMPEKLQAAARRLKHLHIAIENLHAAELPDLAAQLADKAEHIERELHQAHEQFAKERSSTENEKPALLKSKQSEPPMKKPQPKLKPKSAPGRAPVEELREELQRLRAELNELRQQIKK
ncbi:MAG: hypothetical protein FJ302_00740 [Planctomycetes bacterium]|nr:hypothetical protein [Planctomycetota bacterium]